MSKINKKGIGVLELIDLIILWFVGFGFIIFNLLIFQKMRGGSKINTYILLYSHYNIVDCIGPKLRPLSVKLNANTLIIKIVNFDLVIVEK